MQSCFVLGTLLVLVNAQDVTESTALDVDDECRADSPSAHCALSALQRTGVRKVAAAQAAESDYDSNAEVVSNVSWQGNRETGSTCLWSGCDASTLGPSECHHWRCICNDGYFWSTEEKRCVAKVSSAGRRDTGGSCRFFGCAASRGFTRCIGRKCLCYEGYESRGGRCKRTDSAGAAAIDDGQCHKPKWGDACWKAVTWAMKDGIYEDPRSYEGLHAGASSFEEFQGHFHKVDPETCSKPCYPHYPRYSKPSMRDPRQPVMKGVAYGPLPVKRHGLPLNGDDLMSEQVGAMWADWGRKDMQLLKSMGVNYMRLYGNDANTSHRAFLDAAQEHGLHVIGGMSDFGFSQGPNNCLINDWYCYDEAYFYFHKQLLMGFTIDNFKRYHPALKAMIVCNEPDLKLNENGKRELTCRAMASIFDAMLQAEKDVGVTGNPIAFTITWAFADWKKNSSPAITQMEEFWKCLQDGPHLPPTLYTPKNDLVAAFKERWVNSFNTQNQWHEVKWMFFDRYVKSSFWTHQMKIPVFIGEYHHIFHGVDPDLKKMIGLAHSKRYPFFLGFNFFEFTKSYWKPPGAHGHNPEWEYGLFQYGDCILMDMNWTGNVYTVWDLKPQFDKKGNSLPAKLMEAYGAGPDLPSELKHDGMSCKSSTLGLA
eukprot:gb/GFBE01049953.1/.p1 GENE.gb/GFBE01049953.1/~~gb/GFBE01049953.1/.p1  ORF type:complete len:651 (+),score=136.43 gb/GFBE01049953.1/:1-1953(+)